MNRDNKEIVNIFTKLADALEILGENPFKVIAYRKAARVIDEIPDSLRSMSKKELEKIPGIGEGIRKKIEEFYKTGRISKAEEVFSKIPEGLIPLLSIPGLGAKTISLVYKKLNVQNIDDLKRVLSDGSMEKLEGMGAKKVENIKEGIKLWEKGKERILLGNAFPLVNDIVQYLKSQKNCIEAIPAGSFRRGKETIGDIDILVSAKNGEKIVQSFVSMRGVQRVLAKGNTKASCIFKGGIQVDLRIIQPENFGAALQYFTGSKAHNIKLRSIAKQKGLKISEYGIYKNNKKIAGETEEEVYKTLGLPYIPPEIREDTNEIETALNGTLPVLVQEEDIKGDLHVHSKYSDGTSTLEEIARYGKRMGYAYIAVCDHSQSVKYANGLGIDELRKKMDEIKRVNDKKIGSYLIMGAEVDILPDGTLDYPDNILKEIEYVIIAIHTGFKKDATDRILKAFENPFVHAFSHPTGRLIGQREGYPVNMEEVISCAKEKNIALEINAYYERLDLNEIYVRKAKEKNVLLTIGTDAHHFNHMWMMKLGVGMAKRGWLEKGDLLNTRPLKELLKFLSSKR